MKSKKPDDKEYQKLLREITRLIKNLRKAEKTFIRVGSAKTDTGIN